MGIVARLFGKLGLGQWGEEHVESLYKQKGYSIIEKNYFNRRGKRVGEIDLVARKDRMIVFVEVKTRTSERFGTPGEAVTYTKQRRLVRACKRFLASHPQFAEFSCRIDVAEVRTDLDKTNTSVTILENAVEDSW